MPLRQFETAHEYLDSIGIPRLNEYNNNVIVDRVDFTAQENAGNIEWRDDGIYLVVNGRFQRGFMFNKNYNKSQYGNPKFHLFECNALQHFIDNGTLSQYYFWSNSDNVTVTQRGTNEDFPNQRLDLCRNCSVIILERGLEAMDDTEDFHNLLNLNDEEVNNHTNDEHRDIYGRPLNWRSISKAYRHTMDYTCEECQFGVNDLINNYDKRHIHTHHINGYELLNTHRDNLRALCELCHYNQDEHHRSNFEKPRLKKALNTFVSKYRERLIEIGNPYIHAFLAENES